MAMGLATQGFADQMVDQSVVAVGVKIAIAKPLGGEKDTHEVANSDPSIAQFHLQHGLSVDLEGVEKHLPIGPWLQRRSLSSPTLPIGVTRAFCVRIGVDSRGRTMRMRSDDQVRTLWLPDEHLFG